MTEKNNYIESKEKHYLKPIVIDRDGRMDQRFGNITIELIKIDKNPSFLRFMAHAYNDRNYHPPENFEILIEKLFKPIY
jgi:hypothetical protein